MLWQARQGLIAGRGALDATGGGGGGDAAETTAFLARTTGLSGPETAAYKALINGLVADGVWTSLDALYIFATNTETTAQLNLIGTTYPLTKSGPLTFAADVGYTGSGSGLLRTGFSPSAGGTHFVLNAASIGAYVLNARSTGADTAVMGCSIDPKCAFMPFHPAGMIFSLNCDLAIIAPPSPDIRGQWVVTRTASNVTSVYKNGSTTAYSTDASASTGLTTGHIGIMASSYAGSSEERYCTDQVSAAFIGGGLTSAQMNKIAVRINAYMTAFGINVY